MVSDTIFSYNPLMNTRCLLPILVLSLLVLVASSFADDVRPAPEPPEESFLDFLARRVREKPAEASRHVLAFYYTWYGRPERHGRWMHWQDVDPEAKDIASSTNYPALGAYDSHDPNVIDRHLAQARAAGIDGFICTWWGRGTPDDRAFAQVLDRAKRFGMHATIYWETVPGDTGEARVDHAARDLNYILERYAGHPAFLRADGRPVIFVYGRVMGQMTNADWQALNARMTARAAAPYLLVADGYTGMNACLFDGIHTYNPCQWVARTPPKALRRTARADFRRAVEWARRAGKIACLTVIPGYDDRKIRNPGLNAPRREGATYHTLWEEAAAANPDWILITSFNEWHEGSEIEPSFEDGRRYLELTARHAPDFLKREPVARPAEGKRRTTGYRMVTPDGASKGPGTMGSADGATARKGTLTGGKPIAVLPDPRSEGLFYLLDRGEPLEAIPWETVVDSDRFTPERYPVAVYLGHESYRATVREPGDVDRGLIAYLKAGGHAGVPRRRAAALLLRRGRASGGRRGTVRFSADRVGEIRTTGPPGLGAGLPRASICGSA